MTLTPKGAARRAALIEAVLRILEQEGPSAVTHRSVAKEAGVPLAAATYYFDSIDDLLVTAMRHAADEQVDLFVGLSLGDLSRFARELWSWAHETRAVAISQYELMFLAMRRDGLRDDADRWYAALGDAIAPLGLSPEKSHTLALAIDGLCLQMLWRGEPATVEATEAALRELLAS